MDFEAVIGLEVHVQLKTRSKIFCGCPTAFGAPPNSHTCPVCLGMPGVLPVLNRKVVEFALRMAVALECAVAPESILARKNYFYPDLPKGYQISQFDRPLAERGKLEITLDDRTRRTIGVTRIHIEDDAGKNVHGESRDDAGSSFVDLNRTGVPLIEIVSEPDLRAPEEAAAYMRQVRQIVRYLGISDGNMQEGSLRCDANVSVRPVGRTALGVKAELKNMNSFKFVAKALEYEIERQIETIRGGGEIVQETRLWSEAEQITRSMRSKEEAHDYRYFPEPDLVPLVVDEAWLSAIKSGMPELPAAKLDRFVAQYALSVADATVLTESSTLADYFESVAADVSDARKAANWVRSELLREWKKGGEDEDGEIPVAARDLARLINLIGDGTISGKIAKTVFEAMWATGRDPESIVKEKGLVQISDRSRIESLVRAIVAANPAQVEQFRAGKQKVLGFFVGQVMKETKGQANPQVVNEILKELLS